MKTRKELKEEYKQAQLPMGVFSIRNIENGKMFIDCSVDIVAKQNRHQAELKFGNHRNKDLQKDWKTFGAENFVFEILSEIEPKEDSNINYASELELLKEMIVEDLKLSKELQYNV